MFANLSPAKLATARKVGLVGSFQSPDGDQLIEVKQYRAEQREGETFLLFYCQTVVTVVVVLFVDVAVTEKSCTYNLSLIVKS